MQEQNRELILGGEEKLLKLVVLLKSAFFLKLYRSIAGKKILKMPLLEFSLVGAHGLGGELSASSLKANQISSLVA